MKYTGIIETLGAFIDIAGVLLIVLGLVIATTRYIIAFRSEPDSFKGYQDIGRAILLGLEVLVAADIVRTVAVTPTLTSVAVLAGIVLFRTFLSFSLEVELEGRLPWQAKPTRTAAERVVLFNAHSRSIAFRRNKLARQQFCIRPSLGQSLHKIAQLRRIIQASSLRLRYAWPPRSSHLRTTQKCR